MERRFTVKDFFIFLLLGTIMIMVWLAMVSNDRVWARMEKVESMIRDHETTVVSTRELAQKLEQAMRIFNEAAARGDGGGSGTQIVFEGDKAAPVFQRALAASKQPGFSRGDWLVDSIGSRIETLSPYLSSSRYASDVQSCVLDTLMVRDPMTAEWTPKLAKEYPTIDPERKVRFVTLMLGKDADTAREFEAPVHGADASEYQPGGMFRGMNIVSVGEVREVEMPVVTYQLREDVVFSDGKRLTANDIAFSYWFAMDERIAAPRTRAYLQQIGDVRATGTFTVEFTFRELYFDLISLTGTIEVLPQHYYGRFLETDEAAAQYNESSGYLLGSGPYKLEQPEGWTPDQNAVVVRNTRYWGDVKPFFDQLHWRIINDDHARLTAFRNGEIDVYGARPVEYNLLKEDTDLMSRAQNFEYQSPVAGYSYIAWNQRVDGNPDKPSKFADKRVRQAMTFLTDREKIKKNVFLDYATVACGPFPKASKQYSQKLSPRPYDVPHAKALLEAAGWKDTDGDNILDKDGEPFEFRLTYPSGSEDWQKLVVALTDSYARAGIRMIGQPTEFSVLVERLNKKEFEAITLAWTSGWEVDIYQMYHSSGVVPGGDNFMFYINEELDQVMTQARTTIDDDARYKLWNRAHEILYEDQPYTYLFRRMSLVFVNHRIANIQRTKAGLNLNYPNGVPMEWWVPRDKQVWGK